MAGPIGPWVPPSGWPSGLRLDTVLSDLAGWAETQAVAASAQTVVAVTAASSVTGGRVVTTDLAGGVLHADPGDPALAGKPLMFAERSITVGASDTVLLVGETSDGTWTWTPGGRLFLGAGGQMTQTPPATGMVVVVGAARTATTAVFLPRLTVVR